jgi:hypothetical protein
LCCSTVIFVRHNAATFLRKEFGLETARIILGHRSAVITEVYAEQEQKALDDCAGGVSTDNKSPPPSKSTDTLFAQGKDHVSPNPNGLWGCWKSSPLL